ncbi:MAG: hydroxyisourate hydrolase [Candidatus Acidiferrales bacterium]|jgi:5-hydroxyisourate hydrolase
MKRISTHVLDTARGVPARGVVVHLERQDAPGNWRLLASGRTDDDGRCSQLLPENAALTAGLYRLGFDTAGYYAAQGVEGLYPIVQITFAVRDGETRFHIPLLLSPHGYTTYRGS